jgi:hypothetical protein
VTTLAPVPAVRRPLAQTLHLVGAHWPRLLLAALAGAAALGSAVALTATSAWLLSRAAQHPPVLDLMVAIVAVRAFGLARGLCRYAERLLAHDAAFRILARTRVLLFCALERLTPVGIGSYRSGDLLARLVDDVDAMQDVYLRVAVPVLSGGLVGLATVLALGWAAPAVGAALALGLILAGIGLPAGATRVEPLLRSRPRDATCRWPRSMRCSERPTCWRPAPKVPSWRRSAGWTTSCGTPPEPIVASRPEVRPRPRSSRAARCSPAWSSESRRSGTAACRANCWPRSFSRPSRRSRPSPRSRPPPSSSDASARLLLGCSMSSSGRRRSSSQVIRPVLRMHQDRSG